MKSKAAYIPELDGLRSIALGFVLYGHVFRVGKVRLLATVADPSGFAGVGIFFVLSGFLITRLLLAEEDRTGTISIPRFFARRALRLFPALYLYLVVITILSLNGLVPKIPWTSLLASLIYVRNITGRGWETEHLWSLSIEEQFYIFWPFLLLFLGGKLRWRFLVALAIVILTPVWRWYAAAKLGVTPGSLYMRTHYRLDAPMLGCLLAMIVHRHPRSFGWAAQRPVLADLVFTISLASVCLWIYAQSLGYRSAPWGYTILNFLASILIVSVAGGRGSSAWGKLLASKPFVFIGRMSYSIYLWQQLFLAEPGYLGSLRVFPFNLGATFVAASCSYFGLERPLNALKDRRFSSQSIPAGREGEAGERR